MLGWAFHLIPCRISQRMARQVLGRLAATATPWSAFGQSDAQLALAGVNYVPAEFGFRTRDWCLGVHLLLPRMVEESREFPQWYTQSPFGADVAC